jgi:hypothetical protein
VNRFKVAVVSLVVTASIAGVVHAHHSITANFDQSREIDIVGTVVDFNYVSPHASLVIDGIAYENGEPLTGTAERWEIESSAVKGLAGRGITAETFLPGDEIMVRGSPHRNASLHRANSSNFLAPDGTAMDFAAPSRPGRVVAPAVAGARRVQGRWSPPFQRPGETSALPLNEAGLAAWNSYVQADSPANTCEPMSVPVVMNAPSYYVDRTVLLGDDYAPADPNGQWGNVRGRIDGDQLVVDSKDYPPSWWGLGAATQINGGGADVPSSAQKVMTERFSASDDGLGLFYDYTLFDPVYMSREHTARVVLRRVADDAPMVKYDCNVDSARQFSRAPGESVLSTE